MRFIDINRFTEIISEEVLVEWEQAASTHLENIRNLTHQQRAAYFQQHNIWSQLYPYLSELSGNKCWYSEAQENSSEWEVDHYRPKNRSKNENGNIIREDGYWWLVYNWKNYRLAGSLVNKIRKDRFDKDNEPYGKGDFFPLDLDNGQIAQPEDIICDCEIPLLLDPTRPRDSRLLAFNKKGFIEPNVNSEKDPFDYNRARLSIKFYGLDHTPLKRQRKEIWEECERLILEAHNYVKNEATTRILKEKYMDDLYRGVAKMMAREKPYTAVVVCCVKSNMEQYEWLNDLYEFIARLN